MFFSFTQINKRIFLLRHLVWLSSFYIRENVYELYFLFHKKNKASFLYSFVSKKIHISYIFQILKGEFLNLLPNFQKGGGGLDRTSTLRGALLERVTFFRRGCNFYKKDKLKSEIFNDKKKFISKNIFLCRN